jgi:anti-anti-sigma regulatory factor
MIKIKKDVQKNRLYLSVSGIVSLAEAVKAKEQIEKETEFLQPEFDLINDISKFIHGDDAAGQILKEITISLIQKKVNRVVRVVGTSKAGLIQFANNSLSTDSYKIHYVPTLEEAEKFLNT